MDAKKIVVTLPTWNEAGNVVPLTQELLAVDPRIEVLVADDDSPDGTWKVVERLAAENPRVHVLRRTRDKGRGRAGRDAFLAALALGADVVVEMDADRSHRPSDLPRLLHRLENADLVVGSRLVPGGKDVSRAGMRVGLTRWTTAFNRTLLRLTIQDTNSGYRVYRRAALEAIDVASLRAVGPEIVAEVLLRATRRRLRIVEEPISFEKRGAGRSALTFGRLVRVLWFTLGLALSSRRAPAKALAFAALLLACASCGEHGDRAVYDRPNVLLVTLDTVRVDRMSCYGAARKTTPSLERLAADGVRLERCFAQSSFTPPSHASILSSRYVSSHGVKWWDYRLDDSAITLAEAFQMKGFATGCFTPLKLATVNNLKQGFERVVEMPDEGNDKWRRALDPESDVFVAPASAVRERFESWVTAIGAKRPFFAWVHFYDAHRPYSAYAPDRTFCADKTARFGNHLTRDYQLKPADRAARPVTAADVEALKDRYDSGLLGLDREVGLLLDHLRDSGVLDHTIVAIVGDHGEAFDEFSEEWFTHDPYLADAVTHVPLLLRFPDRRRAGASVAPLAETIDVGPTLLDYCGYASEPGMQGVSLRPALEDGRAVKSFAFSERQGRDHDDRTPDKRFTAAEIGLRRSIRGDDVRLIVEDDGGTTRLFERDREPFEKTDVFDSISENGRRIRAAFEAQLRIVRALTPTSDVISSLPEDEREFLRQQGYVGGGHGGK